MAVVDTALAPSRPRLRLGVDGPALDLAVVGVVALPFAVVWPVATSIGALVAFGLAHTVLELRWVLARFRPLMQGRFLAALVVPATVIAVARLLGLPSAVEISAGFTLMAVAVTRLRAPAAALAASALAVGFVASLRTPSMYGLVLAHLHNVVTAVLLWDWSGDWAADPAARRRFRAGLVALYAVVPALILLGVADAALPGAVARHGAAHLLAVGITPPAWATTAMGVRIVAVFAFLQLVHYGAWCWLVPRRAPVADRLSQASVRVPVIVVVGVATALLALVFRTDYAGGRTLYSSVATYHAYLEFPVVLVLLGGARARAPR
jgi:hypothetical protein